MLSKIQVTAGEVTNDEQIETPVGLPRRTFSTEKTTILEAARVLDDKIWIWDRVSLYKFAFKVTQWFLTETQIILWMESSSLPIHQSYSVQGDLHIHIFFTLGKHFLTSKSSYTTKSCFTSKSLLSNCMCLIDFQVLSFQEGEVGRVGLQPQCGRLHRIPDFLRQALFNTTADHSWNISFVRERHVREGTSCS